MGIICSAVRIYSLLSIGSPQIKDLRTIREQMYWHVVPIHLFPGWIELAIYSLVAGVVDEQENNRDPRDLKPKNL